MPEIFTVKASDLVLKVSEKLIRQDLIFLNIRHFWMFCVGQGNFKKRL